MLLALAALALLSLPAAAQELPLRVAPHVQERRLVYSVPPAWPEAARRARIEGNVRMDVRPDQERDLRKRVRSAGAIFSVAYW